MSGGLEVSLWRSRGFLHAVLWLLLSGMLARQDALAITQQTFTVGATITPGCSVTSGTGGVLGSLNFGSWTGVQTGQATTSLVPNSSLSLGCTPGVTLSMSVDGGSNYSSVRNMQRSGGTDRVPYRIYSSSSLAANSEIGVNQSVPVSTTGGDTITLSIFGAAQLTGFSPAGTYTDQLTVTLSW